MISSKLFTWLITCPAILNILSGVIALLSFDPNKNVQTIQGYENWCLSKDPRKLLAGDFNGDSFTDLLCHNQTGEMRVLLNTGGEDINLF